MSDDEIRLRIFEAIIRVVGEYPIDQQIDMARDVARFVFDRESGEADPVTVKVQSGWIGG